MEICFPHHTTQLRIVSVNGGLHHDLPNTSFHNAFEYTHLLLQLSWKSMRFGISKPPVSQELLDYL